MFSIMKLYCDGFYYNNAFISSNVWDVGVKSLHALCS